MNFSEWISSSPLSSILGIIIAIALIIIAMNLLKSITKPIFIGIIVIGVVLIAFNIIDLAFISSTGQKFLSYLWDQITSAAADAASDAASDLINETFSAFI